MPYEVTNPSLQRVLEIERAIKIAKRLLGPPKLEIGEYVYIQAKEDLVVGNIVVLDATNVAKKWDGAGHPNGITISNLDKGNFGWIQTKS